ncbi:tetratricopeptide repeat protein [Candidatus Riflebacteria bacterium]
MSTSKTLKSCLFYLLIAISFLNGCGGSGGGSDNTTTTNPAGPGTGSTATTVETAFDQIESGSYDSAINSFNGILASTDSDTERKQSYNGLGWSYLKKLDVSSAGTNFEKAISIGTSVDVNNEIRVGYASVLFSRGSVSDALTQLDLVAAGSADFSYLPVHSLNISNADVHAMYAAALALSGNSSLVEQAKSQKNKASSLDSSQSGTVTDHIVEGLTSLGF